MRERIPAILGASVLVVVAVLVRVIVFGGSDDDTSGQGGADRPSGAVTVACDPTLVSLCDALEEAGLAVTAEADLGLAGGDDPPEEVDVWVTWGAAPEISNFDAPGTWAEAETIGAGPLALLHTGDAVPDGCGDPLTWACLAEGADLSRPLGVGATHTAEGLTRLFPLAEALVPDDGDFRDVPVAGLRTLVDGPVDGQARLETQLNWLLTRPGSLVGVVGPQDRLVRARDRQSPPRLVLSVPEPVRTAPVVVAPRVDRAGLDLARVRSSAEVAEALEDLGLAVADGPPVDPTAAGGAHVVRQVLR